MTVSMPICCSIRMLQRSAPMRLCARGPSGTLTASTPASRSAAVSRSILAASTPRGGTISTDVTWHSGVRLGAELPPGLRCHLLDRIENDLRPHRAVESDDVGAHRIQRLGQIFDRQTIGCVTVGADSHLRDDRNAGIHFTRRENRLLDLVQIGKRLENEQIATAVPERLELLAESGPRFIKTRRPQRLDANPQRPNSASDKQ